MFVETSLPNQRQSSTSVNPSRKFTLLSNCAYYPGAKPGKKYALNNQYAPNSELRLITRVYGTLFHSLEGNKVGKSGASALADTLRVNQSLKTLK